MRAVWWSVGLVAVSASFVAGVMTREKKGADDAALTAGEPTIAGTEDQGPRSSGSAARRPEARFARGAVRGANEGGSHDKVREAMAAGQPVQEIYDAQRRDEAWAEPVETHIRDEWEAMMPVVLPQASKLEVHCKETLCKVSVEVPDDATSSAYVRSQVMVVADGVSPTAERSEAPGAWRVTVYADFAPEWRDVGTLITRWRVEMAGRFPGGLEQMRTFLDDVDRRDEAER
jgi:hypothetical protein